MSAIGSLVIVLLLQFLTNWPLPASLRHSRNLAIQRQLAEAQPANAELAQKRPRTPAAPAAVAVAALEFRRLRLPGFFQFDVFRDFRGCGHVLFSPTSTTAGTAFPFVSTAITLPR